MVRYELFTLIFMIGFVSAIDVDLDCPSKIHAGESFECEVEIEDGEAKYDLKVEVDNKRDSVLEIWNGEDWQSGYYYVKDFVRRSEDVRLRIVEAGRYDVVLKLRDGEWRKEFDVGRLKVLEGEVEDDLEDLINESENFRDNDVISLDGDVVISLDGEVVDEDEEWDYVSKDGKVVDWLPYLFCLFLIFLIGVLTWDKVSGY